MQGNIHQLQKQKGSRMRLHTLTLLIITAISTIAAQELSITIVTPTYNNAAYCVRNMQSVVDQTYPHWNMIIINDCSTDATSERIHAYVQQHGLASKITIIDNAQRKGALQNLYETIHQCDDNTIIMTLDGDDWFATNWALERVAQTYQDNKTWITYGQFIWYPAGIKGFCRPFPPEIIKYKQFRSYHWISSHLRTFYAWLFKKIAQEDLMYENKFLPMAWDVAMMLPMLEMASDGHITCIEDILYVYNDDNPLNDHKKDLALQRELGAFVASKPAYPTL